MFRKTRHAVADTGPVLTLALIAAAGSFTHIRDTAAEHGQTGWLSWAVAVCVDRLCVMAARERQRDARTGRPKRGVASWPTLVMTAGILLSLAANLAQAQPNIWGFIAAGTPCAAFLVAVSMLERRAGARAAAPAAETQPAAESEPETVAEPAPAVDHEPATANREPATVTPIRDGLSRAIRVSDEYLAEHGEWITRDKLRAALAPCSSAQASEYLRHLKTAHAAERVA